MVDSVLSSVKHAVGLTDDVTEFDQDLILHINSALMIMHQLGALKEPTTISDASTTWGDIQIPQRDAVRTNVILRVRIAFDPPNSGFVQTAIEKQIAELDWRIASLSEESNG